MYNTSNITVYSTQLINSTVASYHERSAIFWFRIMLICILIIVTLIGNLMVLYCLLTVKELQTVTGLFLINLAVTDLSVGMISLPLSLASNFHYFLLQKRWFCDLQGIALLLFVIASLLTLGILSLQKYINVGYNCQRRFTKRLTKFLIACVWIIAGIFAIGPVFRWSEYSYTTGGYHCGPYADNLPGYVFAILLVICLTIPALIMLYCYCRLYIMAHRHVRKVRCSEIATNKGYKTQRLSAVESHMIHTLIIMMIVFFACWLPSMVVLVLMAIKVPISTEVEAFSVLCASANSAVNPILYAMRQKDFQRGFRQIFRRVFAGSQSSG